MTKYQIIGTVIIVLQMIAGGLAIYEGSLKVALLSIGYGVLNAVLYYMR